MLPNAKSSLIRGGFSAEAASWTLIGLFLAGALGIQVASRILHHYIPSHVVDCDHTHEDEESKDHSRPHASPKAEAADRENPSQWGHGRQGYGTSQNQSPLDTPDSISHAEDEESISRRPSFATRVSQLVSSNKAFCDSNGQCYGFSDPCGQGCFKITQARTPLRHSNPPLSRSATAPKAGAGLTHERRPLLLDDVEEDDGCFQTPTLLVKQGHSHQHSHEDSGYTSTSAPHANGHNHKHPESHVASSSSSHQHHEHHESQPSERHHHHVPTNAFLAIGLQTSIAIALHKLPEGFITYATNHANPKLGFSVFLALFIHNISEGFAMALPLYLAINSRGKAMLWSALLGGVSQPMGAGVAALWFKLAGRQTGNQPGEGVYGCMFAIVGKFRLPALSNRYTNSLPAGIMTSVALQLFSESLDLTHNKNLCMTFAFVGMGIMGISSALTV
jgi:ZIP family zinc transporter